MAIKYLNSAAGIGASDLRGFFVGWPNPPSPAVHLKLLKNSDLVELAVDGRSGRVVGFVTAITDKVLCAYIPFLEVLPEYQGRGIGARLVKRMLRRLKGTYMVDLVCDPSLQKFYKNFEMFPSSAMIKRNCRAQSGAK